MLRSFLNKWLGRADRDPVVAAERAPMVSVVLIGHHRRALLEASVDSVRKNGTPFPCEIVVVDTGSADGSREWLCTQKDIVNIFLPEQARRGQQVNLALKATRGKYVLLLGADCLVLPGAIAAGVDAFEACLQQGENVAGLAFYFRNWPHEPRFHVQQTKSGQTLLTHGLYLRSTLERFGWLDEHCYRGRLADDDLCLRLWNAGHFIKECPAGIVEQYFPAQEASGSEHDRKVFLQRWGDDARQRHSIDNVDDQGVAAAAWAKPPAKATA